jgi:biotin transport system substrate-specific component
MIKTAIADKAFGQTIARDAAVITGAIALIALAAQISIPLWPVPVTLSTLAVMVLAATLGTARGSVSVVGYLAAGAIGLPVFAGAVALSAVRPTFGYLVGFVFAAVMIGYLVSRWADNSFLKLVVVFTFATAVIYFFGAGWLVIGFGMSGYQALLAGIVPFLIGDGLKVIVAASLVKGLNKLRN